MTPVSLSFLSEMEDLLADIFNEILLPVLMIAFDYFWDLTAGIMMAFVYHILFDLYVLLLKVLLILEKVFDVFSCNTGVYTMQNGQMTATSGYVDVSQNYSLLDVLMQNEVVVNAVLGMTAGAFVLCFIITLFSVVKSMGEGIGELKRPVSHVVRQTSKACLTFALIPIVCILVVRLAGITIASISAYMPNNIEGGSDRQAAQVVTEALSNRTGKPRRGSKQSQIEQAMAASKTAAVNTDTRVCDLIFYLTVKDALRDPDKASYYLSGQHFQNTEATLKSMDVSRVEWLYAFFEVLLVLIIFMKLIIECMTRIFMILILFVVSPYFVSLMPLDDGAKFKRWKEMFVAFTIGVFGPILSMRLYLVLLPYVVTSDSLNLGLAIDNYARFTNEINNLIGYSVEKVGIATQLFRLFFIAAGGYAVYKSQNLMLDLINPEVSRFLAASSTPVDRILMGTAGRVQRGTMKGLKALGLVDKKNSGGGGDQE